MLEALRDDWDKVSSYDLSDLVRLYAGRYNLPASYVWEIAEECRKYLFICKHRDPNTPVAMGGMDADNFWHFWIYCTPEYKDFSENYLGKTVDHSPTKWWDHPNTESPPHLNAPKEYARIFGYKPKEYLWHTAEAGDTECPVMPGAVSHNTPVLMPGGWLCVEDVKVGDRVINNFGVPSVVKAISAWPAARGQKYVKFPSLPWFMSANLPHLVNEKATVVSPDLYRAALTTPVQVTVANDEVATLELSEEAGEKETHLWTGTGVDEDFAPATTDMMYVLYTDAGFRVKGGINAMTPALHI